MNCMGLTVVIEGLLTQLTLITLIGLPGNMLLRKGPRIAFKYVYVSVGYGISSEDSVELLNAIQGVYLSKDITIA